MIVSKTDNPRALAARAVSRVSGQGRSLNIVLDQVQHPEIGLIRELTYGALRWHWQLQAYADLLLKSPLRRRDRDLAALILVGLYQLEHLRVPAHAAVAETVRACDSLGKGWAKAVVNAVLRRFIRERDQLSAKLAPAARFSHPPWLLAELQRAWPEVWEVVVAANNERPPMVLRVNTRRATRETYLAELNANGMRAVADPYASEGILLESAVAVGELPGFSAGQVSLQDTGAQWAPDVLQVGPGHRVLDACAAPGGKLAHLLERNPGLERHITALDIDRDRTQLVSDGLARLGLAAEVRTADAADTESWWDGAQYQRILIDAPCSGTGVIRRHPDIKHHRRRGDMEGWTTVQWGLLENLWPLVADGGRLLYITCSVLPQENEHQISRFLLEHQDAGMATPRLALGQQRGPGWQTLPGVHPADGFFYALLEKNNPPAGGQRSYTNEP